MTNNLEIFKEFIELVNPSFPRSNKDSSEDFFYEISLVSRGKDHPDRAAANYTYNTFKIFCQDDFDFFMPDIIRVCDLLKIRAYITINKKSVRQIALNTVAAMTARIAQGDFKKIYKEWGSQTGSYKNRKENFWIIDLDEVGKSCIEKIRPIIESCRTTYDNPIITTLPTRSGLHLITRPFNKMDLVNKLINKELDILPEIKRFRETNNTSIDSVLKWVNNNLIHENHITLLYENL